jgi:hypothetical protein
MSSTMRGSARRVQEFLTAKGFALFQLAPDDLVPLTDGQWVDLAQST